jgi:hypothetical protein
VNSPQNPSDDAGKPRIQRPSLGSGSAAPAAAPTASILQTLEGAKAGATAAPVKRNKLPLLAGLSLAAALAAWLVLRPTPVASPDLRVADAKAPAQTAAVPKPAVPAAPVAPAEPAAPAPAQAVARLEQLPDNATPATAAPTLPAAAAATAATAAAAAAVAPRSKPAPRPQASASSKPSGSAPPRRTEPRRTASATKAAPSAAATASARPAAPPTEDRDVELMAALMSHVGALPRNEQATIAGLVANCRTKPRAEADQCRREICDGYWGKAEACPARGKPAAKPAAKTVGKASGPAALTPTPAQKLAAAAR